jgi:hypothetical protein
LVFDRLRGTGQPVNLSSELVHLGGRGGHAAGTCSEVRIHGDGPADGDDATQSVTVVAHPVTHGKNLVRGDRIPGGIEGTSRQATALHRRGHAPIILLFDNFR